MDPVYLCTIYSKIIEEASPNHSFCHFSKQQKLQYWLLFVILKVCFIRVLLFTELKLLVTSSNYYVDPLKIFWGKRVLLWFLHQPPKIPIASIVISLNCCTQESPVDIKTCRYVGPIQGFFIWWVCSGSISHHRLKSPPFTFQHIWHMHLHYHSSWILNTSSKTAHQLLSPPSFVSFLLPFRMFTIGGKTKIYSYTEPIFNKNVVFTYYHGKG